MNFSRCPIGVLIVGDMFIPKRLEPFERLMRFWETALVNLRWVELKSLLGVSEALHIVNDGAVPKSLPDECLILGEALHCFQTLEAEIQVAPMKCEIAKPSRFGAIHLDEFHGIGDAFDMQGIGGNLSGAKRFHVGKGTPRSALEP